MRGRKLEQVQSEGMSMLRASSHQSCKEPTRKRRCLAQAYNHHDSDTEPSFNALTFKETSKTEPCFPVSSLCGAEMCTRGKTSVKVLMASLRMVTQKISFKKLFLLER